MAADPTRKADRIEVRATEEQVAAIRAAATASGKTVSAFVLDAAYVQAQHDLADRRHFVLSPAQWDAFVAILNRPSKVDLRLRRLFEKPGLAGR